MRGSSFLNDAFLDHHALVPIHLFTKASDLVITLVDHASLFVVPVLKSADNLLRLRNTNALPDKLLLVPLVLVLQDAGLRLQSFDFLF